MTDLIKINHVEALEDHWLRIEFSDGAVKDVDLGELLVRGGVFAEIRDDRQAFGQVRVNAESHTIEWPGGLDLDPRETANSQPISRACLSGDAGSSASQPTQLLSPRCLQLTGSQLSTAGLVSAQTREQGCAPW